RKFVRYGLPKEVALASLTTTPAALLAATDQVGTIEAGKRANIVVMNEELFDKQSKMRMLLVDGQLHQMNKPDADVSGTWTVLASFPDDAVRTIVISKGKPGDGDVVITKTTPGKPAEGDKPEVKESKVEAKARKVSIEGNQLTYVFEHDEFGADGLVSSFIVFDLDATPPTYIGRGMLPDGREFSFSGERQPDKLTGVWPTWFPAQAGQAAFQGAALVFDEKNTLTGREPFEKVSPVAVKNFAWDGKTVSYALDLPEQAGGEVTITMTPDLSADPDVARGVVKSKNGEFHFTSVRRDANPFRGTWRVSKADGKDVPADRKEQIRVSIGEKDMRVTRTLDDGTTKEAKGKDEKFEDGTYAFTHSLNELGFDFLGKEGSSSDKLVIRFGETLKDDTIEGTSTFSDGSTHTYVAQREVKDDKKDEDDAPTDIPEKLGLPFGPYAMEAMPAQDRVYLTNATVWTNTDQGVLE
ncbi:MAG: amidohydrolase family protein, partial [Phycisphaerales bacterium]